MVQINTYGITDILCNNKANNGLFRIKYYNYETKDVKIRGESRAKKIHELQIKQEVFNFPSILLFFLFLQISPCFDQEQKYYWAITGSVAAKCLPQPGFRFWLKTTIPSSQ